MTSPDSSTNKILADIQDRKIIGLAVEEARNGTESLLYSIVDSVSKKTGVNTDQVVQRLMNAVEAKEIRLIESRSYKSLASYSFSPYSVWFWASLTTTVVSMISVFIDFGVSIYLRYVFGASLLLFLPGHSLVQALYPRIESIGPLTRFVLSVGLSLAINPMIGLALSYSVIGFRLIPIVFSLGGLTISLLILALVRRYERYGLIYRREDR